MCSTVVGGQVLWPIPSLNLDRSFLRFATGVAVRQGPCRRRPTLRGFEDRVFTLRQDPAMSAQDQVQQLGSADVR